MTTETALQILIYILGVLGTIITAISGWAAVAGIKTFLNMVKQIGVIEKMLEKIQKDLDGFYKWKRENISEDN